MRVLVATDAWPPQVNGVVRTLTSLARSARALGVAVEFLSPEGFPSVPVPTYRGLRLALPSRRRIARSIEDAEPHAIHIATEGPIGHAVRAYCRRRGRPFTTSYTTRFPEYISARVPIPERWAYAAPRRHQFQGRFALHQLRRLGRKLHGRGRAFRRKVRSYQVDNARIACDAYGRGIGSKPVTDSCLACHTSVMRLSYPSRA